MQSRNAVVTGVLFLQLAVGGSFLSPTWAEPEPPIFPPAQHSNPYPSGNKLAQLRRELIREFTRWEVLNEEIRKIEGQEKSDANRGQELEQLRRLKNRLEESVAELQRLAGLEEKAMKDQIQFLKQQQASVAQSEQTQAMGRRIQAKLDEIQNKLEDADDVVLNAGLQELLKQLGGSSTDPKGVGGGEGSNPMPHPLQLMELLKKNDATNPTKLAEVATRALREQAEKDPSQLSPKVLTESIRWDMDLNSLDAVGCNTEEISRTKEKDKVSKDERIVREMIDGILGGSRSTDVLVAFKQKHEQFFRLGDCLRRATRARLLKKIEGLVAEPCSLNPNTIKDEVASRSREVQEAVQKDYERYLALKIWGVLGLYAKLPSDPQAVAELSAEQQTAFDKNVRQPLQNEVRTAVEAAIKENIGKCATRLGQSDKTEQKDPMAAIEELLKMSINQGPIEALLDGPPVPSRGRSPHPGIVPDLQPGTQSGAGNSKAFINGLRGPSHSNLQPGSWNSNGLILKVRVRPDGNSELVPDASSSEQRGRVFQPPIRQQRP